MRLFSSFLYASFVFLLSLFSSSIHFHCPNCMALIVEQESNFKYFCKICKKGFLCGRALGGHMRAHGIDDESMQLHDDDPASDWEDKLGDTVPQSNKRMYALRTNPNRLKSCKVCKNCGKEFLSWKSFLEHGKCTSEDAEETLVSSPVSSGDDDNNDNHKGVDGGRGNYVWSKRKRSFRAKVGSINSYSCPTREEEEELANCLMMLSNPEVDPLVSETEESCASASKDEERRNPMNFIAPLMQYKAPIDNKAKGVVSKGLFECKACKKVFNSHQALGGHRASHKKVKGCFAAPQDYLHDNLVEEDVITHEEHFPTKSNNNPTLEFDNATLFASSSKKKSKVHECSICHRVFSSGQALGGHKRCHWITSNAPDTSTLARFQQFQDHIDHMSQNKRPNIDCSEPLDLNLDLNLPAPTEDLYLPSLIRENDKDNNSQCQSLCYYYCEIDNKNDGEDKNYNNNVSVHTNVDDEADSKVKFAKLSELKDMNMGGSSSPWLQVGISSTTDVETDP